MQSRVAQKGECSATFCCRTYIAAHRQLLHRQPSWGGLAATLTDRHGKITAQSEEDKAQDLNQKEAAAPDKG